METRKLSAAKILSLACPYADICLGKTHHLVQTCLVYAKSTLGNCEKLSHVQTLVQRKQVASFWIKLNSASVCFVFFFLMKTLFESLRTSWQNQSFNTFFFPPIHGNIDRKLHL